MILDDLNAREKFLFVLGWEMALGARHLDTKQPALVYIHYDPAEIRELTLDASDTALKLGEIMDCLRQAFRTTDLIARDGTSFWILAPYAHSDSVMGKVNQVIRTAPNNGLAIAHSNVRVFLLDDYIRTDTAAYPSAQALLDSLLQEPAQEPVMWSVPSHLRH